jgi:hypothetical protein
MMADQPIFMQHKETLSHRTLYLYRPARLTAQPSSGAMRKGMSHCSTSYTPYFSLVGSHIAGMTAWSSW